MNNTTPIIPNTYAIIPTYTHNPKAVEVWTTFDDVGHPRVAEEGRRRVKRRDGGFAKFTWVAVEGSCEVGDILVVDEDGVAEVLED